MGVKGLRTNFLHTNLHDNGNGGIDALSVTLRPLGLYVNDLKVYLKWNKA